jgi:hypothetical protein
MQAQASKRDNPFLVAAGIAIACIVVLLFCAVAIAAIMDWIPVSEGGGAALQSADAPAKLACAQAVARRVMSRTRAQATDYS